LQKSVFVQFGLEDRGMSACIRIVEFVGLIAAAIFVDLIC
jgi:hypothetical protein